MPNPDPNLWFDPKSYTNFYSTGVILTHEAVEAVTGSHDFAVVYEFKAFKTGDSTEDTQEVEKNESKGNSGSSGGSDRRNPEEEDSGKGGSGKGGSGKGGSGNDKKDSETPDIPPGEKYKPNPAEDKKDLIKKINPKVEIPENEKSCTGGGKGCSGGGSKMPYDPDDSDDSYQQLFKSNIATSMLKKLGKRGGSKMEIYEMWGPVIVNKDGVRGRSVIFNPYYKGKDPFKEIFWETTNADGTKGFVRNPFTMGTSSYGYDQSNAQMLFNSEFNPGNIDPWFE